MMNKEYPDSVHRGDMLIGNTSGSHCPQDTVGVVNGISVVPTQGAMRCAPMIVVAARRALGPTETVLVLMVAVAVLSLIPVAGIREVGVALGMGPRGSGALTRPRRPAPTSNDPFLEALATAGWQRRRRASFLANPPLAFAVLHPTPAAVTHLRKARSSPLRVPS